MGCSVLCKTVDCTGGAIHYIRETCSCSVSYVQPPVCCSNWPTFPITLRLTSHNSIIQCTECPVTISYTRIYSPLRRLTSSSCFGLWPSTKEFLAFSQSLFSLRPKPWVYVYIMSPSHYHKSKSIPWWKKSSLTMEEIQFHIGTNSSSISHWNKSNFTMEQIQFHIGTNSIYLWNKSNFILEQIRVHIKKIQLKSHT